MLKESFPSKEYLREFVRKTFTHFVDLQEIYVILSPEDYQGVVDFAQNTYSYKKSNGNYIEAYTLIEWLSKGKPKREKNI
jgi:hypothetical protein